MKKEIVDILNINDITSIFDINKYDNPFFKVIALKIDNKWIGYLSYFLIYDRIEIEYIFISHEYRNKGLAKFLLEELFNIAGKEECINISLEVDITNEIAINLYKKEGFRIASIRKNYYGKNDGYLMVKEV